MAKLFSDAIINEVLDRSNIVELISSYLPLKRAGRNYKTNCPFHQEKTASLIVSSDKQIFHCFGCGVGGNALTFIMQYEKLNFPEALEALAQRSGVPLPQPEKTDFQKTKDDLAKNLYGVYEKAADFYYQNLTTLPEAQEARNYLHGRGISKETAQKFKLGFAKNSWDLLMTHLRSVGIPLSTLERSGLLASKDNGGYYDRFRNRIIFPIADIKDRVIGFGARVLDNSLPKYINSPETPIYIKGKNLFGLPLAKEAIRTQNEAIVVEGYLDMIIPFEAGIKNIVASLGTALTIDQIKLIKRFTNNVVMLYDSDLAGELATLRALELLIKEEVDVKIATLPKGLDPDLFLRNNGIDAFLELIKQAQSLFDFKFNYLISKHKGNTATEKTKIVTEILPTVKKFPQHTLQSAYLKKIAEHLKLDEKSLIEDFKNTPDDYEEEKHHEMKAIQHAIQHNELTQIPITERMLVKLMLDEMHIVDKLRLQIDPSDFVEEKLRKIVQFIFDFFSKGCECKPNILMNYLDDKEAINIISELSALEIHDCPDKEKLITDCVQRLKRDKVLYRCQALQKEINKAQETGSHELLTKLSLEYNSLIKERSLLYGKTCS